MRDAVAGDLGRLPGVVAERFDRAQVPRGADRDRILLARLRGADAALMIAPEEDRALERLTRLVLAAGTRLLGCGPAAVRIAADKGATARLLAANAVPGPPTRRLPFTEAAARLAGHPLPLVLKPIDGCGGAGVVVVRRRAAIAAALRRVRRSTSGAALLAQEYIEGMDASVVVFAGGGGTLVPFGPFRQRLARRGPLRYLGGDGPIDHPRAGDARELACRAVAALAAAAGGVRGYLGVDLVLAPEGARVIEINPRLTTAYVGLRRVMRENPARLILAAAAGEPLPVAAVAGRCRFRADGGVRWLERPMLERGGTAWRSSAAGISAASI